MPHNSRNKLIKKTKNEFICIFSSVLSDAGFSRYFEYNLVKCRMFQLNIVTKGTRSFIKKLKLSKFKLKQAKNSGYLIGFHKAI